MRVKICRKEAKESRLFLRLIDTGLTKKGGMDRDALASEARELTLIFSSIISKNSGSMSALFFELWRLEFCLGLDLELRT